MGIISLFQTFGFQGDAGRKDADDAMHTLFDVLFTMVRMMVSLRDKTATTVICCKCMVMCAIKYFKALFYSN